MKEKRLEFRKYLSHKRFCVAKYAESDRSLAMHIFIANNRRDFRKEYDTLYNEYGELASENRAYTPQMHLKKHVQMLTKLSESGENEE